MTKKYAEELNERLDEISNIIKEITEIDESIDARTEMLGRIFRPHYRKVILLELLENERQRLNADLTNEIESNRFEE